MISTLGIFTYEYELAISFIAHLVIFIGTLYVAVYNKKLPHWHITPLWYVGLFSSLVCITIICQWAIGPDYPLSYWNIGNFAEILVNISVATIAAIMLVGTVRKNAHDKRKEKVK